MPNFSTLFNAVLVMAGFVVGGYLSRQMFIRIITSDYERRDVWTLLDKIAYAGILGFGVVCALGTLGVNVSALIAGLGLTGFALGFALKDALSGAVAGVMILLSQPFATGDRISVAGFEGVVVCIDMRYVALDDGEKKYLVPNSTVLTSPVTVIKPEETK